MRAESTTPMGELVTFRGITRLDLPPERILEAAKSKLKHVVVLGYDKEDNFYFASSMADGGDVLWLIETLKLRLLQV